MDTATSAAAYMLFGWRPIPIPSREKSPRLPNWTAYAVAESDIDKVFRSPSNVGILLGEPSGHLIDVDLDHPAAVAMADQYLPPTAAVFGRESKPRSHRLYYVPGGLASRKYQTEPIDGKRTMFVEVRSTGLQTVFPPSVHPSGESIEWDGCDTGGVGGEPATIDAETLYRAVGELADAAMKAAWVKAKAPETVATPAYKQNGTHGAAHVGQDEPEAIKRAMLYVAKMPGAVSGSGGHAATLTAANALVNGFGLTIPAALEILQQIYNPRCDPPWSDRELLHKCNEAAKLGSRNPYRWLLDSAGPAGREPDDSIYEGGDPFAAVEHKSGPEAVQPGVNGTIRAEKPAEHKPYIWTPAADLIANNPTLAEPIIEGILRTGETMNLIGAPKTGKSCIGYGLALSVATGTLWMGAYSTRRADVLYLDNELHPATAAFRLSKAAEAMRIPIAEIGHRIFVEAMRGKLKNLNELGRMFRGIPKGRFGLIILDAFYRALPPEVEENDNAGMAGLYNRLDGFAAELGAAFCLVHHTSKGAQGEKSVTDVGSGAGAQSRAADAHIVLRPHEEEGAVVMDGVVRSFPPLPSRVFRLNFPIFEPDMGGLDPTALRTSKPRRKAKGGDGWGEEPKAPQMTPTAFVERFIGTRERIAATLAGDVAEAGIDRGDYRILLARAMEEGLIYRKPGRVTVYAKHIPI